MDHMIYSVATCVNKLFLRPRLGLDEFYGDGYNLSTTTTEDTCTCLCQGNS